MNTKYITIEREYDSGGTEIARELSKQCRVPCYGYEILENVSKRLDIPVSNLERYEETVSSSFLYSLYMLSQVQEGKTDMVTKEGHIYIAEQEEIRKLAASGPAIFLGHCAQEALKGRKGVVKVYIRSNPEDKKKRIMEKYKINESGVAEAMKRFDKKRANYYYANTGIRWDDLKYYDIVLDSGVLGTEGCVNVLKGLYL